MEAVKDVVGVSETGSKPLVISYGENKGQQNLVLSTQIFSQARENSQSRER